MTSITSKSKQLSYLLRHRPDAANLTLDREGWCSVEQLIANTDLTLSDLLTIVRTDEKGRYSFSPADFVVPTHIRANQGHSTDAVKMTFKKAVPPTVLYHGTTADVWQRVKKDGLRPMKRHHVHLTADYDTAASVGGRRHKEAYILNIDAKQMLADDVTFYLSENGVWLVKYVDPKYIHLDQS